MKHQDIIFQLNLEEKCYLLSGKDFWQGHSVKTMTLSDSLHGTCEQEDAEEQLGLDGFLPATYYFPGLFEVSLDYLILGKFDSILLKDPKKLLKESVEKTIAWSRLRTYVRHQICVLCLKGILYQSDKRTFS